MDAFTVVSIAVLATGLFLFYRMTQKNKQKSSGRANTKSPWSINWSYGFPTSPKMLGDNHWRIDFPVGSANTLHYVQKYQKLPALIEGNTITALIRITGGKFIPIEAPDRPAVVSLIIQRKGDNGRSSGYRYYSFASIPMVDGEHILSAKLDTKNFGDVLSDTGEETFKKVLKEAESVGLLFGWDSGRGHGVYTDGNSIGVSSVELLALN
jgi:hypothetical protein